MLQRYHRTVHENNPWERCHQRDLKMQRNICYEQKVIYFFPLSEWRIVSCLQDQNIITLLLEWTTVCIEIESQEKEKGTFIEALKNEIKCIWNNRKHSKAISSIFSLNYQHFWNLCQTKTSQHSAATRGSDDIVSGPVFTDTHINGPSLFGVLR